LYGRFVIDTSLSKQNEILAQLSDQDMQRIGVELGVITGMDDPMPPNMYYELSAFAANPMDLPPAPTFKSDGGQNVWIIRSR
jgi:hypothetical protein